MSFSARSGVYWCETLLYGPVQYVNALTSLYLCYVGFLLYRDSYKLTNVFGIVTAYTGIASALFHLRPIHLTRMMDEFGISLFLLLYLQHVSKFSKDLVWLIFVGSIVSCVFLPSYNCLVLILISLFCYFNRPIQVIWTRDMSRFFIISLFLWFLDFFLCFELPFRLTFHALWHISIAHTTLISIRAIVSQLEDDEKQNPTFDELLEIRRCAKQAGRFILGQDETEKKKIDFDESKTKSDQDDEAQDESDESNEGDKDEGDEGDEDDEGDDEEHVNTEVVVPPNREFVIDRVGDITRRRPRLASCSQPFIHVYDEKGRVIFNS